MLLTECISSSKHVPLVPIKGVVVARGAVGKGDEGGPSDGYQHCKQLEDVELLQKCTGLDELEHSKSKSANHRFS